MRKIINSVLAAFLLCGAVGVKASTTAVNAAETKTVEMHRLYNPNSGEHFYTANTKEKTDLVGFGWKYEGVGWYAPEKSKEPVYRLYNENAGDHHYTMNLKEKDALVTLGWKYEGIGWYSDESKQVALFRQYNPNAQAGSHNYTTSKKENDALVGFGWQAEGIGWYGVNKKEETPSTPTPKPSDPTPSPSTPTPTPEQPADNNYHGELPYVAAANGRRGGLPYPYGTNEALAAGTPKERAELPAPGYRDKDGHIYWLITDSELKGYVDNPSYDVHWYPGRLSSSPRYEYEELTTNGILKDINIVKHRSEFIAICDDTGNLVVDSNGEYLDDPYSIFWYVVPAGSAYVDVVNGKLQVVKP